jgi:hypothetical protein
LNAKNASRNRGSRHRPINLSMIWFFERSGELLRIETRHERDAGLYVITLHPVEGDPTVEVFRHRKRFQARLDALEQELRADQWVSRGSAFIPRKTAEPS